MAQRTADLIAQATARTGLADFGGDGFREGLDVLVDALDREARLNETGRAAMDGMIAGFLATRLQIEDWYARHPEIDRQTITAPLIGLGLPRTGSTAMGFLLAEDPNVRFLRNWEAVAPCPPPDIATEADDPRIAATEAVMDRRARLFPLMTVMLPSTATGPTECQTLMGLDFKSQLFQAFAHVPSYVAWLNREADLVPTYRYVKRVLKLLQWRRPPGRWRLKNPSHILFIDALDQVFPDARYWMTHRDVASVVPSVSHLYNELHKAYSDTVDRHALGRANADWTALGMERVIAFRDAGNDHRFFDVQFGPFQRDPLPIMAALYAFLGEPFTDEVRARMAAWRACTPPDLKGSYSYDPADYGLEVEGLRARFRFYSDRFGVPTSGRQETRHG